MNIKKNKYIVLYIRYTKNTEEFRILFDPENMKFEYNRSIKDYVIQVQLKKISNGTFDDNDTLCFSETDYEEVSVEISVLPADSLTFKTAAILRMTKMIGPYIYHKGSEFIVRGEEFETYEEAKLIFLTR